MHIRSLSIQRSLELGADPDTELLEQFVEMEGGGGCKFIKLRILDVNLENISKSKT